MQTGRGTLDVGRIRFSAWMISTTLPILFATSTNHSAYAASVVHDAHKSWNLVWADDFDYEGAPDPSKWAYEIGGDGWGNDELQYYTDRLENSRVENGHLLIEVRREDYQDNRYNSDRLHTLGDGWKFGRIEIRARLPSGLGTWPALWMLPTNPKYGNLGWPDNGEIDIMEYAPRDPGNVLGSIYSKNHIWWNNTGLSVYQSVPDAESAYHIYSMEWSEASVDLQVDGVTYNSFPNPQTSWEDWPFDQQYRLIMNIAIGGWGGGEVDDAALPQTMSIDYVRVYESVPPSTRISNQISHTL